jgi:hypothetical protein
MMTFGFEGSVGRRTVLVVGTLLFLAMLAACDENPDMPEDAAAQSDAMPGEDASASDGGEDAAASDGGDISDSGSRDASGDGASPRCRSQPDRPVRHCDCVDAGQVAVVGCETDGEPTCYLYPTPCVDPGFTICPQSQEDADPDLWAACVGFCREYGSEPWLRGCAETWPSDAGVGSDG